MVAAAFPADMLTGMAQYRCLPAALQEKAYIGIDSDDFEIVALLIWYVD